MHSDDAKSGATPRSKPTTRSSSLRQSLSLASVGKAIIAGVRNKDSSDESKASKKSKLAARRHSALPPPVAPPPNAPRASLGDARPLSQATKRESTPDSKTITRRRVSATQARSSADELGTKPTETMSQTASARATTVRPRTGTTASALPKPRPRSLAVEQAKPTTPVKVGTRRRFSVSSEDGGKEQQKPNRSPQEQKEKDSRPISPLPHRAALKASSAVNATPPVTPSATPSTPTRLKVPTPAANRTSPTRPAKVLKTTNTTTIASGPVRPPSSASSASVSSSFTPRTPTGSSTLKSVLTRSAKDKTVTGTTPVRNSPITPSRDSPSPLARFSRKNGASSTSSHAGNMSHISEAASEDSEDDDDDVLLLLAPVANMGAPTPAMPRIQQRPRIRKDAETTPSKSKLKPQPSTNKDKSRLAPPTLITSASTRLRVPRPPGGTSNGARHSILSWEQISNDVSRTLGEGEVERMITDVAAPFSGPTSPALSSLLDIPPSPCLSAIDSPGGFGSISQVLLPDVTPSPAVFSSSARFSVSPEAAGESSSTYLRLQLASADGLVQEKSMRIQAMEEEIHNLKQAHMQQMEEVAKQMAFMEREDERAGYTASLEEQLRATRMSSQQAVQHAVRQTEAAARADHDYAMKAQRSHFEVACAVMVAETNWGSVGNAGQTELDAVRGERAMLALLLADLEYIDVFS